MAINWISSSNSDTPLRADDTSKEILVMGISPMVVLATTSAVPLRSNKIEFASVTVVNRAWNAALFNDRRGMSLKVIARSATFPVDTPLLVGALAS